MYQLNNLPKPDNKYDCVDLVTETELLLEMLDEDPHYIEDHNHISLASELLECLNPEVVMNSPMSNEWKKEVLMWLFNAEVIAIARNYDVDHYKRDEFKEVCKRYIEVLNERSEKLTKDF